MQYQKFAADYIFNGYEIIPANNVVVITNTEGRILDIVSKNEAGEDILFVKGMISPGFINCHCHLELSHLKGIIPKKTGLIDFILQILNKRSTTAEIIQDAIEKAEAEMIQNGIVAVGDIANTTNTIFQKQKHQLYYHNFVELSGFSPQIASQRFQAGLTIYQTFLQHFPKQTSIVAHAPYSVSPELFQLIAEASSGQQVTSIHNQESIHENPFFLDGSGDFNRLYQQLQVPIHSFYTPSKQTSLATVHPKMQQNKNILWVHNNFTSAPDIQILEQNNHHQNHYWCICIAANKYIENVVPPIKQFHQSKFDCVIGTDSLASNHQLNILEELKIIKQHFSLISDKHLLQWSTLNGAKALNIQSEFGSIEKGKKPGLNCIDNLADGIITQNSTVHKLI
ncbi:MAG: amidohydrolase family protein [Chitinophagaceae bacterium]